MVLRYLVSAPSFFTPFNVVFAQRANLILLLFIEFFIVGGIRPCLQAIFAPYRRGWITEPLAGFDLPFSTRPKPHLGHFA